MSKFKIGDKVRLKDGSKFSTGKTVETIVEARREITMCPDAVWLVSGWITPDKLELVKAIKYEEHWTLNDGKVDIPDDAQKLKFEDSVVAFRKVKPEEFKFGELVKWRIVRDGVFVFLCKCGIDFKIANSTGTVFNAKPEDITKAE